MLLGLIILLIMSQPDLGTTLVVVGVAATMFFVAGASLFHILFGMGILGVITFILPFLLQTRSINYILHASLVRLLQISP